MQGMCEVCSCTGTGWLWLLNHVTLRQAEAGTHWLFHSRLLLLLLALLQCSAVQYVSTLHTLPVDAWCDPVRIVHVLRIRTAVYPYVRALVVCTLLLSHTLLVLRVYTTHAPSCSSIVRGVHYKYTTLRIERDYSTTTGFGNARPGCNCMGVTFFFWSKLCRSIGVT
jgi:hypothetical protein